MRAHCPHARSMAIVNAMFHDGQKCSGVGMVNSSGCNAAACAAQCCNHTQCVSYVHGIAPGCDQTEPLDPQAICCWLRIGSSPQIVVKRSDHLSTGEVAGHGGSPSPAPHGGGGGGGGHPPPAPPAPELPAGVFVHYSTLVFTCECHTLLAYVPSGRPLKIRQL